MLRLDFSCALGILILATFFCSLRSEDPTYAEGPDGAPLPVRQLWLQMDKDWKAGMSKLVRRAMPVLMKEVYRKDISSPCMSVLLQFTTALRQTKMWAFQMLDSSGRFPEGFLSGTTTSLGNYEECLQINVNENRVKVKGQYCTLNLLPPIPTYKPFSSMHLTSPELVNISEPDTVISYLGNILHNLHVTSIKVGVCTPSQCTKDDLNRLAEIIPEKISLPWKVLVNHCEIKESLHFTRPQIFSLYIIGVVLILLLVGTAVDKIWTSKEMEKRSLKATVFHAVKAFSLTANAKKLAHFTCPQEKLSFVYGIVFINFYWVFISNTFMYVNYDVAANITEAFRLVQNLFYEIVLNRILPLQVLFFVSGMVTTYRWMKSSKSSLNIFKFILQRYLRYTPGYALVLVLLILSPSWGSGPTWYSHMNPMYVNCRDSWWYNILYINNYIGASKVCLDHTWIFAVDAQLQIIAIFILILLKLRPKIGLILNCFLAVASLASVALTNVYYDLPPNEMTGFINPRDRMFYAEHTYFRVYTHVGIFCVGIFVGYLMSQRPNIKISRKVTCLLWLGTSTALMAALCIVHEWRSAVVPSPLVGAVYTTFSKVAEAAFLAWLSVACMTGHAGGLPDILGWRPFAFLGRLSFIAYTIHVPIMNLLMSFKKSHTFISHLEIFDLVLNHVAATFVIAYLLHLCFEAPWISLGDVICRRTKARTFTSDEKTITEKPVRYSEKDHFEANKSTATTPNKSQC